MKIGEKELEDSYLKELERKMDCEAFVKDMEIEI